MFTQFGQELRLGVEGQLVESRVCRDDNAVLSVQETRRDALIAKGWIK
jgi:hypothetical protein